MSGVIIYSATITSPTTQIDFSNLQKGLYILKLKVGNSILMRKVIKE